MSDYINREDALIECANSTGLTMAHFRLLSIPSADVVPVKHGHWIKISPAGIYECSECGKNVMTSDIEAYEYCHGCGARVDGDNNEID